MNLATQNEDEKIRSLRKYLKYSFVILTTLAACIFWIACGQGQFTIGIDHIFRTTVIFTDDIEFQLIMAMIFTYASIRMSLIHID